MIDRIFTLTLTFAVLAGGTLAIGGEFFKDHNEGQPSTAIAELPRVVVTGNVVRERTDVARAEEAPTEARNSAKRVQ